jgi:serine/threonine protein kinase
MYKRIIPPEILEGHSFTKKSDIFCYGLILYELLTNKRADGKTVDFIQNLESEASFLHQADRDEYMELIRMCSSRVMEIRPPFEECLKTLDLLEQLDFDAIREKNILTAKNMKGEYV